MGSCPADSSEWSKRLRERVRSEAENRAQRPKAEHRRHRVQRFEGGAQGEHKLARALLPVQTSSAHWLAYPDFARAVQQFLSVEGEHIDQYMDELALHSPLRQQK